MPIFADWCSLELLGEDGQLQYREVAHTDLAKVELAREYRRLYPARPDDRVGVMRVFRTGQPEFFAEVSDEHLVMGARDQEELRRLRELGLRSVMIVPLTARGRTLGALTLVTAESSRRYGEDDLRLALELGSRAALAVDNARLFEELRANDRRKDEFLAMLAHELRNPLAAIDNAVSLIGFPRSRPRQDRMERRRHRPPREAPHPLDRRLARRVADHQGENSTAQDEDRCMSCPQQRDRVGPLVARGTTAPAEHSLRDGPHSGCGPDPTGTDRREPALERRQVHRDERPDLVLGATRAQ